MHEWRTFFEYPDLFLRSLWFAAPVCLFLGRMFYGSWGDFLEALRYLYQPGWLSLLRGEYDKDSWETLVFYIYVGLCGLIGYGSYHYLIPV